MSWKIGGGQDEGDTLRNAGYKLIRSNEHGYYQRVSIEYANLHLDGRKAAKCNANRST